VDRIVKTITRQPWERLASIFTRNVHPEIWQWCKVVSNPRVNTLGSGTYFNIPNDADDTSLAVAIQRLHRRDFDPTSDVSYNRSAKNFRVDVKALSSVKRYRDLNRTKSTTLDAWKGPNTGAFMTWLRDENAATFGNRSLGVIPSGVNLVDEVVNANVVFSMALNGLEHSPGFKDAERLIARAATSGQWKKGGIFYPGTMSFPYAASRAYRDGGARGPVMKTAMRALLRDVLRMQRQHKRKHPRQAGAFPGGIDRQTHLSTALGLTFLLNVGEGLAVEAGLRTEYRRALNEGISYLLRERIPHRLRRQRRFEATQGVKWREGICGAGDPDGLSLWVSEAASTAMALEALSKYAMAYEKTSNTILDNRRIEVFRRVSRRRQPLVHRQTCHVASLPAGNSESPSELERMTRAFVAPIIHRPPEAPQRTGSWP
jgi:hypothetical protein